jgi:putative cell wall-binding protein
MMRPLRLFLVIALLLAVLLSLLASDEAQAAVSYSTEEIAFVQLLNDYRVSQGVPALLVSNMLSEACDRHNSDMAKYGFFDHYTKGSDWFAVGSSPWDRMAASGYTSTYRGENIAAGYPTAASVFAGWKASSAHRENMLNRNFKVCGVSLVNATGSVYGSYWTTDFGGYVDVTAHPLPAPEPAIPCPRLIGSDRYDTAIKISQAMFPGALPPDSGLVLAPGETFQEALCGAPLAAAYAGPVLLTQRAALNSAVQAEIVRLAPRYVICIGLSDAIVAAVEKALGANGTAIAIRGTSVYDMSRRVAGELANRVGGLTTTTAIITRGDVFPDAISASPLACAQKWPILLTGPTTVLNANAVRALAELRITTALKVGTYVVLPLGVAGVGNLSGANRYETNRNVASWSQAMAGLTFAHSALATGDKFPDALAAGPYLALDRGILLLTPLYGPLPTSIAAVITANRDAIQRFSFIAIVEPVLSQTKALLP